jgi:energy-coupling factor transporter ATP-binding protein EcfA2
MPHEIKKFQISNLYGQYNHTIEFISNECSSQTEARVCVIIGANGIGKTTILNMIEGMLQLDFNAFRNIPFDYAELELTSGNKLSVRLDPSESNLIVNYDDNKCILSSIHTGVSNESFESDVDILRNKALPILTNVSFEKVDIHRSIALRQREQSPNYEQHAHAHAQRIKSGKLNLRDQNSTLSGKVRRFVREAQVDYRKYFTSEGPELFPKIIKRLQGIHTNEVTIPELIERLTKIKLSEPQMSRFGLSINMSDIDQLTELLISQNSAHQNNNPAIAALEAYVETLESKHAERCLISQRLVNFESLISGFLQGKSVTVDYEMGLLIKTNTGEQITELQLSSGEYHLLYMLITALVCTRTGTAIAIDEPELSLHISWQRKLIKALISCSSGASPLFIFATHSSAISAEYQDQWISLGKN